MSEAWLTIADGVLAAAINPLGAELSSLTDAAGREWMTDAHPAFWTGRAPLLFPIVGALNGGRYRLDGREYAMAQHGFARRRRFELVAQAPDALRLRLIDDAKTRAIYPFAFSLEAAFTLRAGTLEMVCTVTNRGDAPMPASFGYHPAFAWPLPGEADKAGHGIRFDQAEPDLLARLDNGLIAGVDRASPLEADGRTLLLDDALFADDALIWPDVKSRSVSYAGPNGATLRVDFPQAHQLGIWTKPGARFVCIEPWWGHADPAGFAGDLCDKPGMLILTPGEARNFAMQLTPQA
ncbi:aldose 1-epimerase family protein [Sphingomonas turrisvirgatae]|uniref:Aldose epimerase n=1 Tax=Sphingomonas turrisvirgatae TaxID=1888892 RepID=A0A1E3LTS0_9SPHN|nr:aldose 1-epimerase family protein [Sphingomonas turrisvirgatae]ODP37137.1 aldose epimerase [Sphingomonas turrisvirgatae]